MHSVLLAVWLGMAGPIRAADAPAAEGSPPPAATEVLRIGVKPAPPFSYARGDGTWTGLTVDLVEAVAADMGHEVRWVERDLTTLLDDIEQGRLDAGAAALTIDAAREARMDFSTPYFDAGLGIARRPVKDRGWAGAMRLLVFELEMVALLLVILGLFAGGVFAFERKNNEMFEEGPEGLFSAFWWAAATMTTVGYGDKVPQTFGGRMVGLVWMFGSVVIVSTFTAMMASAMTVGSLDAKVVGPDDLRRAEVGAIAGTTGATWLAQQGIYAHSFDSLHDALKALEEQRVDAVVHDRPLLAYEIVHGYRGQVDVLPHLFARERYGVAFPEGSELKEPFDRALLHRLEGSWWAGRSTHYLGELQE